ncbi:hypothetical protein LZ554_003662 [Drepanopeziza brunnea f. sp. 'monogermtubi']|nr:hypothetical protein LZ554_003662 [Drepanopeziza brunnea f. sp. 'monogermtubi']
MRLTTFLTSMLAITGLTLAAPRRRDTYYGVSLELQTSSGTDPNHVFGPAPVELNKLTALGGAEGVSVSRILIDANVHPNIPDINQVECRGYKDAAGITPGTAPFSVASPAEVSTNLATVSSVLCYVVTDAE